MIDADPPDELWCLGDLVGYGPRPNEVVEIVRERAQLCLVGNHDLGVLGRLDLDEFSPDAATVATWTRTVLLDENRAYLERLEPQAKVDRAELFHASPRDPVWEYVVSEETALAAFQLTVSPLVLVGHSMSLSISLTDGELNGTVAPRAPSSRWTSRPPALNLPVGQPRDGDPRARLEPTSMPSAYFRASRTTSPRRSPSYASETSSRPRRTAGARRLESLSGAAGAGKSRLGELSSSPNVMPRARELTPRAPIDAPLDRGERDLKRVRNFVYERPTTRRSRPS